MSSTKKDRQWKTKDGCTPFNDQRFSYNRCRVAAVPEMLSTRRPIIISRACKDACRHCTCLSMHGQTLSRWGALAPTGLGLKAYNRKPTKPM